jgi:hypothetical protein
VHADPILPVESLIIYVCKCIMHLCIGILWKCCYIMITILYYHCYPFVVYIPLVGLCLILANGRIRVVGPTQMQDPPFYSNGIRMEIDRELDDDLNLRSIGANRGKWSIFGWKGRRVVC